MPVSLLVNANNLVAFFSGNSGNKSAMKERVKLGYEGAFTDHVTRYDELTASYQKRSAVAQLDAESLPYDDNSFDIVISGMVFGLFPNQGKAVSEMFRVLRPGGLISLGAHGPEHYWEAIDTTIRSLNKIHVLGYRFEFWPRTEKQIHKLLLDTGFRNVHTNRFIWRNLFKTPTDACEFFAAVSSNWWYAKIPERKRLNEYQKTKQVFEKMGVKQITDDVIIGYGKKPE